MIRGDHQKILAADMKEETRKDFRWHVSWSLDMGTAQRLSETGQILLTTESSWFITCHPFIRHGWKVILQSGYSVQIDLQSWQMPLTWSNTEQKLIFSWLVYTAHSICVLVQTCMLPLEACMFSETSHRHQWRQAAQVTQPRRLHRPGHGSTHPRHRRNRQWHSSPRTWPLSQFSQGSLKTSSHPPPTTRSNLKNLMPTFSRGGVGDFWLLRECLSLFGEGTVASCFWSQSEEKN